MQVIYRSNAENTMDPYSGTAGTAMPVDDIEQTWVFFPNEPQNDDPQDVGFYCERSELTPVLMS